MIAYLIVEVGHATLEVSSWRQLFNLPDRHILSLFILDKLALLKTAPLQPMIAVFKVVLPNASEIKLVSTLQLGELVKVKSFPKLLFIF